MIFALTTLMIIMSSDSLLASGQKKLLPIRSKKLQVNGTSQFLGYLNAYLDVKQSGRPLTGLSLFLNRLKLNDRGGGIYSNGTPHAYPIKQGNMIRISLKANKFVPAGSRGKPVLLGSYRVRNTIEWVYPKPDTVLPLGRRGPRILPNKKLIIKWNYTGRVRNTQVRIKDFTANIEIFNKTVMGESVAVPISKFKSGKKYRLDLEVVGAMGKFKMTNAVTPSSEVKFYYWTHCYFFVK